MRTLSRKNTAVAVAVVASLACAAGATVAISRRQAREASRGAGAGRLSLTFAQSLGEAATPGLEALLAPFVAANPRLAVRVVYTSEASSLAPGAPTPDLALLPARAARPMLASSDVDPRAAAAAAVDGGGTPFVTSDWTVLAYDRRALAGASAPATFAELTTAAEAYKTRRAGEAHVYGVALSEAPVDVLPFFAPALFASGARVGATQADVASASAGAREAFELLGGWRFARGLTPHGCTAVCAVGMLSERRAAFALVPEARLGEVRRALGEDLGVAPFPAFEATGAVARSPRRDFALYVSAVDALDVGAPAEAERAARREAGEAIVRFLATSARGRVFRELGKLPLPLADEAAHALTEGDAGHEAELAAALAATSVAVTSARLDAARAALGPAWASFADGDATAEGAAAALVSAASSHASSEALSAALPPALATPASAASTFH